MAKGRLALPPRRPRILPLDEHPQDQVPIPSGIGDSCPPRVRAPQRGTYDKVAQASGLRLSRQASSLAMTLGPTFQR